MKKQLVNKKWLDQITADYVSIDPNTGCWLWTGGMTTSGYGYVRLAGKMKGAHRIFYELIKGPISDGVIVENVVKLKIVQDK